jgi:hypothetical protein
LLWSCALDAQGVFDILIGRSHGARDGLPRRPAELLAGRHVNTRAFTLLLSLIESDHPPRSC